jgi:hypothetical protein
VRRELAFWLMGGLLGMLMVAAAAPSPLYAVYQAAWGFSAVTLTAVFAVYAVALLGAFLVAGRLSDHLGRKPVIVAALALQVVAMACFAVAGSAGWLFAARVVQGIATGTATGAVSAALVDLAPGRNPQLAPLVNSAAPSTGLAAGALGSSLLVAYGPDPMRLVYWLLLGLLVVGLAVALAIDEPGKRRPGVLASLRPQAGVPRQARRAFVAGVPVLAAGWALGGFYLALGPGVAASLLDSASVIPGGLVIFLLTGVGAAATVAGRRLSPTATMGMGSLLLAAGTGSCVAAIAVGNAAGLFVATAFSGIGFGFAFLGVFRTLIALAPPTGRAGLVTSIYVVSYLAFSLPVVAAGIAVTHIGLRDTAIGYGSAVAVLAAAVAAHIAASAYRGRPAPASVAGQGPLPPGPCCAPGYLHAAPAVSAPTTVEAGLAGQP